MILRALFDLYERLERDPDYELAPPGRSFQRITFVVVLQPDGPLFDIQDARQPGKRGMLPRRVLVLGTTKPSGAGLNPCFLWDAPGYLLGWDPDNPGRARRTFEAFRKKHLDLESHIACAEFSAVCRFLESWDRERALAYPILEELKTGFGVFQIRGQAEFVHEHPEIVSFWDSQMREAAPGPAGQCLITGESAAIARLHPKLKGVANSQPSGATIAGFNDPAYWSYGLEQSFNAPVSEEAARRYTSAVNAILEGPKKVKHRLVVGGTTVAFWTDRPSPAEDIFLPFMEEGSGAALVATAQDETVRAKLESFLRALQRGREAYSELDSDPDGTLFFILGLAAPTPARVAVRFFHRGTLAELLDNLRRHHLHIHTERRFGDNTKRPEPEHPPAWFLLKETAPPKGEIPPVLPGKFIEAVVTGRRYPEALFGAVMRRIGADRVVSYARACLIKGYLVRNLGKEVPVSLDLSRTEPAYRLGRLFAALEKTQQEALDNINTTIRDRFYAAASATPASVFPRLLRTYQHHLGKLEAGHKVNREKLVQEILAAVDEIPAHLGLAEQGLFALGYYHQMNAFFTKKEGKTAEPSLQ
ncbi:MAG: type I-C CRISPR-associated protein Cas8c/Csd1 [Acidobacteriota bacterium]|jgi:CRISPR-associated protein Csd1